MQHPRIWRELGEFIHQDFFASYPDFWSGIHLFLSETNASDRIALAAHIRKLLDGRLSDDQLFRAWEDSGAEIIFSDVRAVLTELLRNVE
jgi:hypothetical protein